MTNIAIFASGGGSNAAEICKYFEKHDTIKVSLVVTNISDAGVLNVANQFSIPSLVVTKKDLENSNDFIDVLSNHEISFIVLAGFLLLIPSSLIKIFPNRILNIHPSLLPKYGGKGMYGHKVHDAVKRNQDNESGMTIHLVNEKYDEGQILFQASCELDSADTSVDIGNKVLRLEHAYYSKTIENYIFTLEKHTKTN